MSSVWGMSSVRQHYKREHLAPCLQYRRDLTENVLKATLNPNKQQQLRHKVHVNTIQILLLRLECTKD